MANAYEPAWSALMARRAGASVQREGHDGARAVDVQLAVESTTIGAGHPGGGRLTTDGAVRHAPSTSSTVARSVWRAGSPPAGGLLAVRHAVGRPSIDTVDAADAPATGPQRKAA
jgi:hypothetical protein